MALVIDIGSQYIHFIQGKRNKKIKCSMVLTPKESLSNGEIVSIEEIRQVIKKEIKRSRYQKKKVTFLVHSSEMVIKEVELPIVKSKEMPFLLEQEVMGLMIDRASYLIDYKIIEKLSDNTQKVMITAMPKTLIEGYIELAKALGIKQHKIDIYQNSISKLIENKPLQEEAPILLADIGNSMLHLHLFEGQKRIFSRSVFINTEQYRNTLILMDQLKDEEAFMKLDLSAQHLQENQVLFNLMSPYLASMSGEMQNMLQFQLGRNSKNPVQQVYIYGGMSEMKGLAQYLENDLLIPVKDIQLLEMNHEIESLNSYIAGIGEIYSDKEKGINFSKAYKQAEKGSKQLSKMSWIGGGILAGQLIVGGGLAAYMIVCAQNNMSLAEQLLLPYSQPALSEKLVLLDTMTEEEEMLKQQLDQLKQDSDEIRSFPKLDKVFWNQLRTQMTETLAFSNISYESGQMSLTCEAYLEQDILDFVHQLRQLETVQEVNYTGYTYQDPIYQFNIQIIWKGGISE